MSTENTGPVNSMPNPALAGRVLGYLPPESADPASPRCDAALIVNGEHIKCVKEAGHVGGQHTCNPQSGMFWETYEPFIERVTEPKRCACGKPDAYALTPGERIDHGPDACVIVTGVADDGE